MKQIITALLLGLTTISVVSCTLNSLAVSSSTIGALSFVETSAFEMAADRVFTVLPYTPGRLQTGGTGFLLKVPGSKDGKVVLITNRHICDISSTMDAAEVFATGMSADGFWLVNQGRFYTGIKIKASDETDLCAIEPSAELLANHSSYEVSEKAIRAGDKVTIYGHPRLLPLTAYSGAITNVMLEPLNMSYGPFNATQKMYIGRLNFQIFGGNSGSPIVDRKTNKVAGVAFAMDRRDDVGLFVPRVELIKFISSLGGATP